MKIVVKTYPYESRKKSPVLALGFVTSIRMSPHQVQGQPRLFEKKARKGDWIPSLDMLDPPIRTFMQTKPYPDIR